MWKLFGSVAGAFIAGLIMGVLFAPEKVCEVCVDPTVVTTEIAAPVVEAVDTVSTEEGRLRDRIKQLEGQLTAAKAAKVATATERAAALPAECRQVIVQSADDCLSDQQLDIYRKAAEAVNQ